MILSSKIFVTIATILLIFAAFAAGCVTNKEVTPVPITTTATATATPIPKVTIKPTPPPVPPIGSYKLSGFKIGTTQFYLNPNGAPSGAQAALQASMNTWDAVIPGTTFKPLIVSSAYPNIQQDGISVISFSPTTTGAVAETHRYGNGEFDMVFNSNRVWGPGGYNLQHVATHEFGHVIGLDDIYDPAYSYVTMYGQGTMGDTYKSTLAEPDLYGVYQIYGLAS